MAYTLEQKIEFWRGRGMSPENMTHIEADGTARPYTEKEFEQWCLDAIEPEELLAEEAIPAQTKEAISNRIPAYPKNDWQLYRLVKGFKYLRDQGIDIGPDAGAVVDAVYAVKAKYPKAGE